MEWHPIETAPIGRVLAFWDRYRWEGVRVAERLAKSDGGHWWRDPHSGRNLQPPTHWMPIPAIPQAVEE